MGGATTIGNSDEWKNITKLINGRFYNIYSKHDNILSIFYYPTIKKIPIGLQDVVIEGYSVYNNDLTFMNIGHLDYRDRFTEITQYLNLFIK